MPQDDRQLNLRSQRALPQMNIRSADRTHLNPRQDCAGLDLARDRHLFNTNGSTELPYHRGLAEFRECHHDGDFACARPTIEQLGSRVNGRNGAATVIARLRQLKPDGTG